MTASPITPAPRPTHRWVAETGMGNFIAGCGSDAETIRLLAQEVMPKVA